MIDAKELAAKMETEIVQAVRHGAIPPTAASFEELHDYCDANCLGGTESLWESLPTTAHGDVDGPARDALMETMNAAMDIVDAWIKAGGINAALTIEGLTIGQGTARISVGDSVKWRTPQDSGEAEERYTLIECNGDRGLMQYHCEMAIKPVTAVRISEIVKAD